MSDHDTHTTTNTAEEGATIGIQTEQVHNSNVYVVSPEDPPERTYQGGAHSSAAGRNVIGHVENHYYSPELPVHDTLPGLPGGFIGREADLEDALEKLNPAGDRRNGEGGVPVVTGMGGVGKTALATAIGHTARDQGWFSLGLLLNLHGYSPDAGPITAAEALESLLPDLGVPPAYIPSGLDARARRYRSQLQTINEKHGGPVLVVADNAAEWGQVEPLLPGRGGHRLLVTSRDRLGKLQTTTYVEMDMLSEQAAVELLRTALVREDSADARADDADGLARVARGCECLPMALWICAGRLCWTKRLTPAKLADQLEDTSRRLESLNPDDRSKGVRAAFDASFQRLPDRNAEMFTLLALNPGHDFAAPAAAALANADLDEVTEVLDELTASHLLVHNRGTDRWAFHDLLADYAKELLEQYRASADRVAADPDRALARLLAHYTTAAAEADAHLRARPIDNVPKDHFRSEKDALTWLNTERINLIAAVHTADRTGRAEAATALALALAEYLNRRGDSNDLSSIAEVAKRNAGDRQEKARAVLAFGVALLGSSMFRQAREELKGAKHLFVDMHDRRGIANSGSNLGATLVNLGYYELALGDLKDAESIFADLGDRRGQAATRLNSWYPLMVLGDSTGARRELEEAKRLFADVDDCRGKAGACLNLGILLKDLRDFVAARRELEEAKSLFDDLGDHCSQADACENLAYVLQNLNDQARACEEYEFSKWLRKSIGGGC